MMDFLPGRRQRDQEIMQSLPSGLTVSQDGVLSLTLRGEGQIQEDLREEGAFEGQMRREEPVRQ